MKYMKWSYDQLMVCPAAYVEVIDEMAKKEAEALKHRTSVPRKGRR